MRAVITDIKKRVFLIGIDPGVETGFCVWNSREKIIRLIATMKIHQAMDEVKGWISQASTYDLPLFVRVEDAPQRPEIAEVHPG